MVWSWVLVMKNNHYQNKLMVIQCVTWNDPLVGDHGKSLNRWWKIRNRLRRPTPSRPHIGSGVYVYLYEYMCTWNPNGAPCFDWKRPCFGGGLTFKIELIWVPGIQYDMFLIFKYNDLWFDEKKGEKHTNIIPKNNDTRCMFCYFMRTEREYMNYYLSFLFYCVPCNHCILELLSWLSNSKIWVSRASSQAQCSGCAPSLPRPWRLCGCKWCRLFWQSH